MTIRLILFVCTIFLSIQLLITCQNEAQAQTPLNPIYKISGKVDTLSEDLQIILASFDPISQSSTNIDTTEISEDGTYELTFEFQYSDLFKINFPNRQSVMLAIDKGQNDLTVNVEGIRKGYLEIKGSPDSEKLQGYESFRAESLARLVTPTYAAMRAAKGDPEKEVEAVQAYGKASEDHRKELIDYAKKNIGNSVALFGTVLRWTGDDEVEKLDELVTGFKTAHPDLPMTKVMEEKVDRFKKVAIGAIAPALELPDSLGNVLNLNDLKGKYTLLDFWASWCGPCLLQVPDLKEAYDNYHEKGFEIIGVSVDSKGNRWKKSIQKYEMNWPHISDLKGWKSQAAADYNVTFIPFNMLIDSEGKILAKNLHSKELQEKLKELFSE